MRFSYANSLEKIGEALQRVGAVLESARATPPEPKGALPKKGVPRTRARR